MALCPIVLGQVSAGAYAAKERHADGSHKKCAEAEAGDQSGGYPEIHSRYAVLIDAQSGKVLYSEHPYAHREPASTTKMMAAILLLEDGRLNDTVVAPAGIDKVPESSLHLSPGERISLKDLLYAMLLRSANDTPVAGAHYLCGSVPSFVALMNQKAREIGCRNTHFVTPNGLYNPDHYSCAYDLALIARYAAIHLPTFNQIVRTQRYVVHRSIHKDDSLVVNTASTFLKTFPGADGIKTGFISQAGHCFVGSATRNGWRLIAVALDSGRCREDVMDMLSYGFAQFHPVLAIRKDTPVGDVSIPNGASNVPVMTGGALCDVIPKATPPPAPAQYALLVNPLSPLPSAPVRPGEVLGTVTLEVNGKAVASADALAAAAVALKLSPAAPGGWAGNLRRLGTIGGAVAGAIKNVFVVNVLFAIVLIALIAGTLLAGLALYARAITKNTRRRRARLAQKVRAVD